MPAQLNLHPDRFFPAEPGVRAIARELYAEVKDLPLISPHGHTDPAWYAEDITFPDPATLFLIPDHYLFRMLYSHGVRLEDLGIPPRDGGACQQDPRKIWRIFAEYYYLFRGTPSRLWLDHVFYFIFGIDVRLGPDTADEIYDLVEAKLKTPPFKARALYDSFNLEALSTTDSPLDDLKHHAAIAESDWSGRVVPAFRPDSVVDPEFEGFADNVARLSQVSGEDASTFAGYVKALAARRQYFKEHGCTSTDHGHPSPATADLSPVECEKLYAKVLTQPTPAEAELFRAQMLTEMVKMSLDDGLVIQLHPGSFRNHNRRLFQRLGRDMGADLPLRTDYVKPLKPLLDKYGSEPDLSLILFTLDETTFSRELAPLAGHYPLLKLGPAWWFYDSPEGMRRYRAMTTETAGFYNTVGFNDDTRAFLSIPARHDLARRIDCGYLAGLVAEHRLDLDEAVETARDLAYNLAKQAYRL